MLHNRIYKLQQNYRRHRKWIVYAIALLLSVSVTILSCAGQRENLKLGSHHHPISTKFPQAQRYFDQGLTLVYGFNHGEAVRSFATAVKLDPDCAMCHWGIALALGPNINMAMKPEMVPIAWQEAQTALKLSHLPRVTPAEKDYIQALQARYHPQSEADRNALDRAYAEAMQGVVQRYPTDADAATLAAEALMDTTPWNYWEEGKPRQGIEVAIAALETAIKLDPNHPGAHHYYIHLMENAPDPKRSLPSAEKLGDLVPGIAHLVHMPSHIYQRVGRYQDAVVANQRAIAADRIYTAKAPPTLDYYHNYLTHNYHFLWSSAVLSGQRKLAIQTARDISQQAERDTISDPGTQQNFSALPLFTLTRFGQWQAILAEPKPSQKYVEGVWHYARGMALANMRKFDRAKEELRSLQAISTAPDVPALQIWEQPATKFLEVTVADLSGTLADRQGNTQAAIGHLTTAFKLANDLSYSEFGNWFAAIGYSLGQVLLKAGQAKEAEAVYRQELGRYPENGWSLFGLARSLKAQGKTEESQAVQKRFATAWKYADFKLESLERQE